MDRPAISLSNSRHFALNTSATGNVLGLACGAKFAPFKAASSPSRERGVFGCSPVVWASEANDLGILLFVRDNASHAIVEQGSPTIIPNPERSHQHTSLVPLDDVSMARLRFGLPAS